MLLRLDIFQLLVSFPIQAFSYAGNQTAKLQS